MLLDDDEHAVTQAREFALGWSTTMDLPPDRSRDIALVLSELVTNAVRHGRPPFVVDLSCARGLVRGEVLDASSDEPRLREHADESGGFGLLIVARCSTRWGCSLEGVGKRVWFEIPVP